MGPFSCIGLIFTPTRLGSTSSSTASTTSNRMRARFSIPPPYSSVRRLVVRLRNWASKMKIVGEDLYAVESGFDRVASGARVVGDRLRDFIDCHGPRFHRRFTAG